MTERRLVMARPGLRVTMARRSLAAPAKKADAFLQSPAWKAARAEHLAREPYCRRCGRGGAGVRMFVDHIVERKDGGALVDAANLQTLCGACHTRKTREARKARAGGE